MKKLLLSLALVVAGAASAWAAGTATPYDPAQGIVTKFGPEIPIHFLVGGNDIQSAAEISGSATVTVTDADGNAVEGLNPVLAVQNDQQRCLITISREVTEPGTYKFNVSAGLKYMGLVGIGASSFTYIIEGAAAAEENYSVIADPASGETVAELGTIDVRFQEEGQEGYLSLVGGSADELDVTLEPARAIVGCEFPDNDHSLLRITVAVNNEPLAINGTYTITVKQPVATTDNPEVPTFYFDFADGHRVDMRTAILSYTIEAPTGISAVEAEQGAAYYDLMGRAVANPQGGVFVKVQNGKAVKVVK